MPINVTRAYKLGKKKEVLLAFFLGEITQTEAAKAFGVTRQNFGGVVATIVRQMLRDGDEELIKVFINALNKY